MRSRIILWCSVLFIASPGVVGRAGEPEMATRGLIVDLNADKGIEVEDGDRVVKWTNQVAASAARDFVKQGKGRKEPGSGRPTLRKSIANLGSHNSVVFRKQELVNDQEDALDHLTTGSGYTWFAVLAAAKQTPSKNLNCFFGNLRFGAQYEGFWAGFNDDNKVWMGSRNGITFTRGNSDNPKVLGPKLTEDLFYVLAGRMGAGTDKVPVELFVNDAKPYASLPFPVNTKANASRMTIGQERDAINHPGLESFNGEIARIMFWERPLTDAELADTLSTLKKEYAITTVSIPPPATPLPAPAGPASVGRDTYGAPASTWTAVEAKAATQPAESRSLEKKFLAMRLAAKAYYEQYKLWTPPQPSPVHEGKLRNLADAPTQPRFALTGKDWPQKSGDASVCLWEDDKIAAMSFFLWGAVDSSVKAAMELSKKYPDARFTGSLIVGFFEHPSLHPGGKEDHARPNAWDVHKEAFSSIGFHYSSQSMTWDVDPVFQDGWPGPEWECAESIRMIDARIPAHKTKLFMMPGAYIGEFNVARNWLPVIKQYYSGQIGKMGGGINPANQIDYFNIESRGSQKLGPRDSDPTADAVSTADNFNNLLNSDPKNPYYKYYRGWIIPNAHMITANTASDPSSILFGKALEFLQKHKDDIWCGCIDDVALYGQERDTATLKTTEATDTRISLNLTTRMEPTLFDYPLTVKVRIPDSWQGVVATQEGKPLAVQVIQHEKANYALVKIVPDRGTVFIEAK